MPLAPQLAMATPQLLFLLRDGISFFTDDLVIFVWTQSLLANEFVMDVGDLAHMLAHAIQVLSSPVDIEENFGVFWLCYRWEDPHELTIILCDDILLEVLAFSVDTLQHLLVLFTSMVATWKFSIQVWVFSMEFVAIAKSECLNITVPVVRVKQVISLVMQVVLAA